MQRAIFDTRIAEIRGKLALVVSARNKWREADVFRLYEDGKSESRSLYLIPVGGYLVDFKGRLEPWGRCMIECKSLFEACRPLNHGEKTLVLKHHPEFHWVLGKTPTLKLTEVWKALPLWKKYPSQVESLLAAGFTTLALSPSVYTLGKQQKRMVLDFIRKYPGETGASITEIRTCANNRITPSEYWDYKHFCSYGKLSYKGYEYLRNQIHNGAPGNIVREYLHDYKQACLELGKDWSDPYWQFPSNYRERHDKVMEQLDAKHYAENAAKIEAERKQEQEELMAFKKVCKRFAGKFIEDNGYEVHIVSSMEEIVKQADSLNQCLVTCEYYKDVAAGVCLLAFVTKDGFPSSTAEILPDGKIGQFYGNEKAENIYPSEAERKLVDAWIQKFYRTKRQRKAA